MRESGAPRLLGLRVRIPPGAWTRVCCEYYVLSEVTAPGRSLYSGVLPSVVCLSVIYTPQERLAHSGCRATKRKSSAFNYY